MSIGAFGARRSHQESGSSAAMAEPQQLSKNQKKKAREKVRRSELYEGERADER